MAEQRRDRSPIGHARPLLGINTILIGIVAFNFVQWSYANDAQELWYRYGFIALFVFGSVIPAMTLWVAPRSPAVVKAAIALMIATFAVFVWYGLNSGSGS